jgi:hypothetical protein
MRRRSTTTWIDGSDDSLEEGCGWIGRSGAIKDAETCVDAAGCDADGGTSADGTEPSGAEPAPSGGASSAADMAAPPHRAARSGSIEGEDGIDFSLGYLISAQVRWRGAATAALPRVPDPAHLPPPTSSATGTETERRGGGELGLLPIGLPR